jgi:peptidoglycan/LPS O-acetylase OafA/YrhL
LKLALSYRPEIDGLRALAVLPVILFHAGFSTFSGGFVGVDVFFVISGYLITSMITTEIAGGTFSLWDFYERRARRILPALFLVMICCIPFAWAWMLPMEMKAFSTSIVGVVLFVSNFVFWRQSGYFEAAAELKPLLHTWSLAVEEQYYILFPVAVILVLRMGRRNLIWALAILALISLSLSHYLSRHDPSANFYLLPTRAWELMAGALCSFVAIRPSLWRDNVLSICGVTAIGFSIFTYDESIPFPSLYALLPVLGTCAIILFAGERTAVRSMLSLRPLVGMGLISYSAYLWHQPLFAFARIRSLTGPGWQLMLLLAAGSIGLAYLSWRFVEIPARRRGAWPLPGRRTVYASSGVVAAMLIAFGLAGHFTRGFPARLDDSDMIGLESRLTGNLGLSRDCQGEQTFGPKCRTREAPEVVLWGDSYAKHLADGLLASNPSISLVQLTLSVCGPILGLAPYSSAVGIGWSADCIKQNDRVADYIRQTKSLRFAILSSPFAQYVNAGNQVMTRDQDLVPGATVALASFRRTLHFLVENGIEPIVVAPPPRSGFDVGKCLAGATIFHQSKDACNFSRAEAVKRQKAVREFLVEIAKDYRVIWLDAGICDDATCYGSQDGVFIYRDHGHLTREGSTFLGRKMSLYDLVVGQKP